MANPKYYYHITQKKWPPKLTLYPRVDGDFRSCLEPEISRTCVAPTIEGCLIALGLCLRTNKKIYIYRTENKVLARNPFKVLDSHLTKEKWITKPIIFKKIGIINDNLPKEISLLNVGGLGSSLKVQKKYLNILKNMKLNFVNWY